MQSQIYLLPFFRNEATWLIDVMILKSRVLDMASGKAEQWQ